MGKQFAHAGEVLFIDGQGGINISRKYETSINVPSLIPNSIDKPFKLEDNDMTGIGVIKFG